MLVLQSGFTALLAVTLYTIAVSGLRLLCPGAAAIEEWWRQPTAIACPTGSNTPSGTSRVAGERAATLEPSMVVVQWTPVYCCLDAGIQ